MKEEKVLINRHIDKHEYFRGIADLETAKADFINNYMWMAREMYCDKICPNKDCDIYRLYLKNKGETNGKETDKEFN